MIALSQIAAKQLKSIETDKIVFVKVIEQQGNKANIEINGVSIEATIETEIPPHFLAVIEKNGADIRLRLLSSFKQSADFNAFQEKHIADNARLFFLQNGISFGENLLRLALRYVQAGLKLDKEWLRLTNMAELNFGPNAGKILIFLAKHGLPPDDDFVDFFFGLKKIIREGMLRLRKRDGSQPQDVSQETRAMKNVLGFMQGLYGTSYSFSLTRFQEREVLVQSRKESGNDATRYYFDLSEPEIGSFLIVVDDVESVYDTTVWLDAGLLHKVDKKGIEDLTRKISAVELTKRFNVHFKEKSDDFRFYLPELSGDANLEWGNLDISI
jgi:hypothetical protein